MLVRLVDVWCVCVCVGGGGGGGGGEHDACTLMIGLP